MATTIKLKNGSGAPLAGDLVQGEPALDLTNKRLYTEDSGGSVIEVGTNPTSLTTGTFTSTGIDDNATSTAITIDSSQNVGIGTTNPTATLNVQRNTTGTAFDVQTWNTNGTAGGGFRVTSSASNSNRLMELQTSGTTLRWIPYERGTGNEAVDTVTAFHAGGSEAMRITSSGNVGIGTANPTELLTIATSDPSNTLFRSDGTVLANNFSTSNGNGSVGGTTPSLYSPASATLAISTNSTERMRIAGNGDISFYEDTGTTAKLFWDASTESLGIGTDSPVYAIDVKSSGEAWIRADGGATSDCGIRFAHGGVNHFVIGHEGDKDSLQFFDNIAGSERMIIDSSGRVGIGNSSPSNYTGANANNLVVGSNSGNNGITIVGGTAGYSSLAFSDSAGAGTSADYRGLFQYNHNTDTLNIFSAGTERMRINSSGNVQIGTTNDWGALTVSEGSSTRSTLTISDGNTASLMLIAGDSSDAVISTDTVYKGLVFKRGSNVGTDNGTETMRLDASGNLLVGTTIFNSDAESLAVDSLAVSQAEGRLLIHSSNQPLELARTSGDNTSRHQVQFFREGAQVGTIACDNTSTTYNTTSDQRLKENIVDAPAGNIDAIRVRSFDWKADGSHQTYGMVAQELVDVAPEAVTQGATEDDMWGVDYSKLVPMLVKEIQDLRARVAQLEGA